MELTVQTIDLSKIKYVLCDYDDTVCIHQHVGVKRPTHYQYVQCCEDDVENYYTEIIPCVPNKALKWFFETYLHNVKSKDILTWSSYPGLVEARHQFLRKHYPNQFSDVYKVKAREFKYSFVAKYMRSWKIKPQEILYIDDHPDTLDEISNLGVQVLSTSEIDSMCIEHLLTTRS